MPFASMTIAVPLLVLAVLRLLPGKAFITRSNVISHGAHNRPVAFLSQGRSTVENKILNLTNL